jgi:hypothetical protein
MDDIINYKGFELSENNYFSTEADQIFMSVSQYKNFVQCEAAAMAKLRGEWKPSDNTALLVGSYVHSHFEGALDKFKQDHPEIFTKQGTLRSEYQLANEMISVLEKDAFCMMMMQGEKEVIMAAELFGIPWKIKIDSYNPGKLRFTDLKTTKDFERVWNSAKGAKESFVEAYGYLIQIAVYREVEHIFTQRETKLDAFMVAVTKQNPPDKAIISFDDESLNAALEEIPNNLQRIIDVKHYGVAPEHCGHCEYCRATKKVSSIIHFSEL